MDTLSDLQRLLEKKKSKLSQDKVRGEDNANRGFAFQDEYSYQQVLEITSLCETKNRKASVFNFGIKHDELCFINDLVIRSPSGSRFSQVKDVIDLYGKKLEGLKRDCEFQKVENSSLPHPAYIEIVLSKKTVMDKLRAKLDETRRAEIEEKRLEDVHVKVFTPSIDNLSNLILGMCDETADKYDVEMLLAALSVTWKERASFCSLQNILESWNAKSTGVLRLSSLAFQIDEETEARLNAISNISIEIRNCKIVFKNEDCTLQFSHTLGSIPWQRFVDRLSLASSWTFNELSNLAG